MECNPSSSSSPRVDRRTIEKNRRIHMKGLYSNLNSLVPHDPSREVMSLPDQLQEAANYIKNLQIKLERMKEKKNRLMGMGKLQIYHEAKTERSNLIGGLQKTPQIDVQEMGLALQVILTTSVDFQFLFSETIRLIHEEGADVVHASFSILNDTVFHTIHAEVGEKYIQGDGAARITERLNNIVFGDNSTFNTQC